MGRMLTRFNAAMNIDTAQIPRKERVIALIPCYNTKKYIRRAVLSLLNQTRKIDLIVILNDCSTDGFESEVEDLLVQNDNLVIHNNPRNLGRSGCRNEGFDKFPADYYILNDADDESLPNRVEISLQFMKEHRNCGAMGGFVEYIDAKGKVFGKGTQMYCFTEDDARGLRESMEPVGLFCSSVCIRGEVIQKDGFRFDTSLPASEDIDMWNRILEKGWDVMSCRYFLSRYRVHSESICTAQFIFCKHHHMYVIEKLRRRRQSLPDIAYEEYYRQLRSSGVWKWVKFEYPIYAEYFYRTGGAYLLNRRYVRGLAMLMASFVMKPSKIRRLLGQRFGWKV